MIPGYMVWCALAYAIGGSWLAWRVGRPLIALNATRYAREAELRFALVRVSENAEGIALHGSEAQERQILDHPVDRVATVAARVSQQPRPADLGDLGLRLARARRADPNRGTRLLQWRPVLRRADHGDRRL